MLEALGTILVVGALAFVVLVGTAYVVVRVVFVRMAERISAQIAVQIDSAATQAIDGVSRRLASTPHATRAINSGAAAGRKIRELAAARGMNLGDARTAFLERLDRTARLMDSAIPLPLIGGIGLDALLGLVPFVGDAASALVAGSIILNALQYGLPKALVAQMVANMFVDVLFGAIPLLGDLFDVLFKANTRNMALLRAHLDRARDSVGHNDVPGPGSADRT